MTQSFDIAQVIFEQALCHAALLVERLMLYARSLGLRGRDGDYNPLMVSDQEVSAIFGGFRKIARTAPDARRALLPDPVAGDIDVSRAALLALMDRPEAAHIGFVCLVRAFGLQGPALEPLLLALAPEWDARIARLFGAVSGDVSKQRPTMGQLQMIMCSGLPAVNGATDVIHDRLVATGLVKPGQATDVTYPNREALVPDHIVELSRSTDAGSEATDITWDDLCWNDAEKLELRSTLHREIVDRPERHTRLILFEGLPGSGRQTAARVAAREAGLQVEVCNLDAIPQVGYATTVLGVITRAFYRARVLGRLLIIRSDGKLRDDREGAWLHIADLASGLGVLCFVLVRSGELESAGPRLRFLRFMPPHILPADRRTLWARELGRAGMLADELVIDDVAGRYDLTPGRVGEVVGELAIRQRWESRTEVAVQDVRMVLREITVQRLQDLATLYQNRITLADLVLSPEIRDRLAELTARLRYRHRVLDNWNFGAKGRGGYGVSALFTGPPGTGKTAAAGAVANALEIDLYIVDLSRIMSKWVGETEQNLAKVFDEAETSNVALLFDEADSLFGKRTSDAKSGSDRFANLTVNYLLQRMETYAGLAILTTNLESGIDKAFSRRITTRVHFPEPNEDHRLELWKSLLPSGARYAGDVELGELVERYQMPGARIKTALTRAAFLAARDGRESAELTRADLLAAAAAEYEDMGRIAPAALPPAIKKSSLS